MIFLGHKLEKIVEDDQDVTPQNLGCGTKLGPVCKQTDIKHTPFFEGCGDIVHGGIRCSRGPSFSWGDCSNVAGLCHAWDSIQRSRREEEVTLTFANGKARLGGTGSLCKPP